MWDHRNALCYPLVRDTSYLRRTSEAAASVVFDGYQRFADGQHYLPCPLET